MQHRSLPCLMAPLAGFKPRLGGDVEVVMKLCVQLGAHGVLSPWQKAGRERAFASLVYASDTQPLYGLQSLRE